MERMHFVVVRITPDSDGAAFAAYISDAYIVAAQREAHKAGRPEFVAHGDIVLAAILAAMWVQRVPRAYAGAVLVNGEGRLEWRYHLDCERLEVCAVCGESRHMLFLKQGVCDTCRSVMPHLW